MLLTGSMLTRLVSEYNIGILEKEKLNISRFNFSFLFIIKKIIFLINGYFFKIPNLLFADRGLSAKFISLTELCKG